MPKTVMFIDGATVTAVDQPTGPIVPGMVGRVLRTEMNIATVAFTTCLVEAHMSAFAPVRKGRAIIKAARKLMQQPFNGAACDRALAFDALDEMAEARYKFQREPLAHRFVWRDVFEYHRANNREYRSAVTLP